MNQNSIKRNAFFSVIKEFFSLVFPIITFPYATRILLPDGIGKINFANSIISYFIVIANLGINGYATREATKIRENKQKLTKLYKELISINLICCFFSYCLFFVTLFFIPKFYEYRNLLFICSIKIIFSVLSTEWVFTAYEEFKYLTIRSILVQLISIIYLFIFVKTRNDLLFYAIFTIFLVCGNCFCNLFYVKKFINFKYQPKLEIRKHFKSIIIFLGMSIVTSIYTMLDTTMLGFLSTDIQVGYYSASTKLGHMVLSLLTAITGVLLPRFTKYIQTDDKLRINELIINTANILILLSIPIIFGLIILAKPIIIILAGEHYIPSISSMRIIALIILPISFGSLIGVQLLPSIGKEKVTFYSYLIGAFINILLNSLLIPKHGAIGASISTVFSEITVTLFQLIYVRKYLFNKEILITLIESLFSSFIMSLCIKFILTKNIPILIILISSFIIGIFIYSLCLLLLRNKTFLSYLKKLF